VTAADPARLFYYSGSATLSADNTAALPNGVAFAGGLLSITRDGTLGDTVFGLVTAPVYLNGTSLKNSDNHPILAADRTITINAGGAALTAGWVKTLTVNSRLTGAGGLNINYDTGWVILGNIANDYAGDTTIATQWAGASGATSARLRLGAAEVLPHGAGKGSLVLNANATLDLSGFSETVNGLVSVTASALITNASINAAVLRVGANNASSSYAGRTGGAFRFIKSGTGTVTLGAYCGHTGATVVEAGTLSLGAACLLTNSIVEVKNSATLAIASGGVFGGAGSTNELLADTQARLAIPARVEATVFHFAIGGQFKKAGVWGPTGSGADFVNDALFEAEGGTLRVLETGPQRGTFLRLK
jgi:autotransporter-associated beta strand protein